VLNTGTPKKAGIPGAPGFPTLKGRPFAATIGGGGIRRKPRLRLILHGRVSRESSGAVLPDQIEGGKQAIARCLHFDFGVLKVQIRLKNFRPFLPGLLNRVHQRKIFGYVRRGNGRGRNHFDTLQRTARLDYA